MYENELKVHRHIVSLLDPAEYGYRIYLNGIIWEERVAAGQDVTYCEISTKHYDTVILTKE